jgi:tetratricopeptide (TPR) repeat protein
MRRISIAVITVLFSLGCFCQQQELDSLLAVLKNYSKQDSTRLQLLNDIAYNYSRIDPGKGLKTADEAITLAKTLRNDKKLASANTYKAMNYAGLGEDSISLEYYRRALAIHQYLGDSLRMATTYNNMAIALVNMSRYTDALTYHEKAFSVFERLRDSVRMGNSLNNRGVIFLYLARYKDALNYHLRALTIFERLGNVYAAAATLVNIGLVYDHLAEPAKALNYQQRAYDIYKASGDKHGMINTLGNLGNVYHSMDRDQEALQHYEAALAISEELGDKRGITSNTSNMAIVYSGRRDFARALALLERSLVINTGSGDKKRIAGDLHEMARIYLNAPAAFLAERGISQKERFRKIDELENRNLQLSQEIGSLDLQREAWNVLSESLAAQKKFEASLQAYKKYVTLRDSIINDGMKQDIARKEMQFEFEKKEVLLKAEQDQKQALSLEALDRQRLFKNAVLIVTAVLLAAAIFSFMFYKRRRDAEEKRKETEFKLKTAETEMEVLRLQMNPHFIFNSLNSVNQFIDTHNTEKAILYTTRFSKLMRITLESSRKKEIILSDDLAALELYLQLETLRLNNSFSYRIELDASLDPDTTLVPPMLLQPFVENSIWHGLSKKTNGNIFISIKRAGEMIECIVEDNGTGRTIQAERPVNGHTKRSMGIQITRDRIDIINQLKKSNGTVELFDLEEGTRVQISFPFESYS